jgi:hypothetical protein
VIDEQELEDRIRRAYDAVATHVVDTQPAFPPSGARRGWHRPVALALAGLTVAATIALVFVFAHDHREAQGPVPVATTPLHVLQPGEEDYMPAERLANMPQFLKEYDAAEVQYLVNMVGGRDHTSDMELVGTLEFRRACRETQRMLDRTAHTSAVDTAAIVDGTIQPQAQRLIDREPDKSQAAQMFRDLGARIKRGDRAGAQAWLSSNCSDALRWKR